MIIELRIKQQGVRWEDIAPIRAHIGDSARRVTQDKRAASIASAIADGERTEVRWNYQGSLQGHYVGRPRVYSSTIIKEVRR